VNATLLETEELTRSFGATRALDGVSFTLQRGQVLTVLGPNGAGKTTLLGLISGTLGPDSGRCFVDGVEARLTTAQWRSGIGVVSHLPGLYDHLTARENLRFFAALHGLADAPTCIARALDEFGLADASERPVRGFSRGMLQRLALARGLLHDPEIVLLDEPFTGVDREGYDALSVRLRALADSGKAVLLVTHHLELGATLSDRMLILRRGQVAYSGGDYPRQSGFEQFYAQAVARGGST